MGGSGLNLTEPRLRVAVASGSQEDPVRQRRVDEELSREFAAVVPRPEPWAPGVPITTGALAARGTSLEHLCRRVALSLTRSACPASLSTVVAGQDDLKRRINEYMLQRDYRQSIGEKDGEEPMEAIESPPQTDMDSYY